MLAGDPRAGWLPALVFLASFSRLRDPLESGCELGIPGSRLLKTNRCCRKRTAGAEARLVLWSLTARLKSCPSQSLSGTEFFSSLLKVKIYFDGCVPWDVAFAIALNVQSAVRDIWLDSARTETGRTWCQLPGDFSRTGSFIVRAACRLMSVDGTGTS